MGVAATWLPPELSVVQPYSMSPVIGCPPVLDRPCPLERRMLIVPASGTAVRMDDEITVGGRFFPPNVMMIKGAFVASARVQRAAQKEGEQALIMQYPAGLLEALGLAGEDMRHTGLSAPKTADVAVANLDAGQTFIDALRALEDED
jgi:hypothetical protein